MGTLVPVLDLVLGEKRLPPTCVWIQAATKATKLDLCVRASVVAHAGLVLRDVAALRAVEQRAFL